MGTIKIICVVVLCFVGGISSAPPLQDVHGEFDNFEEIIPLYRLPQTIVPKYYRVELQPILDEGYGTRFTAPGKVWIHVECLIGTNNITLHALTLNISESSVKVTDILGGNEVGIASFGVDLEKDFFIINLQNNLRAGGNYQIYIEYVAPVSEQLSVGLYLSKHAADDGSTRYMAVTDLEATDARRVFPCFDEPQKKAEFDICIIRLEKYHSLSNKDLLRTEPVPELPGWVKDIYNRTDVMSTYLFCVAVSDFDVEEATPGQYSKPVKIWGPPMYISRGAGKYSADLTAKFLTAMESYFRFPYTFPKMDKIAVDVFGGGAMENWGLNTYKFNRLLIEDGIATTADRISTAITLSHELVHQWFGNLVTMKWWDDLWLNEGFASYYSNTIMMDIGLDDMLPLDTLVSDAIQRAMAYDVTSATHPVHYTVTTPTEIRIMFDTITYSKGGAMVRMMESILTEPIMRNALLTYFNTYKYSNAHQDDLFKILNAEVKALPGNIIPSDLTIKDIMDTWTLQSGFPVLIVDRVPGSSNMMFRQEKFRSDTADEQEPTNWHIPISLQSPGDSYVDRRTKVWLKQSDIVQWFVVNSPSWIIVNPQQTGYYRVKYDSSSLGQIIEQLHTDHTAFDPQTRSALIDDNLNLAIAGYITLQDALNLTMYLVNERHLVPWTSFFTNMAKPYRFLARSSGLSGFKKYITGLVKDTLEEINIDPQPSEPVGNATILRNKLFEWACNLGDNVCVQYSRQKFTDWMEDPGNNSIIFPDLRPFVYCTAIANGGDKEWDFVLAEYKNANRDVTKTNLIRSLACSKHAFRLTQVLELAISQTSGIENGHRVIAMQAVAGNSVGADIAFNFIRNNFETIRRRFGVSMFASVITTLSNTLDKAYDAADIEKFLQTNEEALTPVNATLQTAMNNIRGNVRWVARNAMAFRNFVDQF